MPSVRRERSPRQCHPCRLSCRRIRYHHRSSATLSGGTKTAADAAAAIGVDVGQIVKSLIFAVDGELWLGSAGGPNQLAGKLVRACRRGYKAARMEAPSA